MRDGAQARTWRARHKTVRPRTQNREPEFAETQAPSQCSREGERRPPTQTARRGPRGRKQAQGPYPTLAETRAPNEGDPCRVASEGRGQKESGKGRGCRRTEGRSTYLSS